ncbi:hypothetical protein PMLGA01_080005400 [Plasmodium malariae]|uniref:Uncharacterized protein n=1 Tax=Plasmodium malariae TaxID=5858 RepID=A0A1C3KXY2_PLAMA|nr:hypothetical protein PMLGA01_080005400 [Plasmodium malariae]
MSYKESYDKNILFFMLRLPIL